MEDIENLKIEVEQLKEENEHLKAIKNIDDVLLALREKKQPSEIRFLRWVVNMTTGWRINGFNNQEEALREIERVCRERINYVSS